MMDSGVEIARRREGFTEGKWITGADCHRWCFPVITADSLQEFESIRRHQHYLSTLDFDGDDNDDDKETPEEHRAILGDMLVELLSVNYEADPAMLRSVYTRVDRSIDMGPLAILQASLTTPKIIRSLHLAADVEGLARRDVVAFYQSPVKSNSVHEWCKHDGVLFEN